MIAKFVVLSALVAIAYAGVVGPVGGTSYSARQQDDFGNYAFQYQVNDGASTHGRAEAGNKHGVVGSYNLGIIDGRQRKVDYVADGAGFRAKVATNEQGTALSAPASSLTVSPYAGTGAANTVAAAPAAVVAAPAIVAAPAVAPIAVAAAPYGVAGVAPYGVAAGVAPYGVAAGVAPYGVAAGVAPYGVAGVAPAYGAYGAGVGAYGAGVGAYGAGVGAYGVAGLGGYGVAGIAPYGVAGVAPYGAYGAHGLGYGKSVIG